VLRHVVVFSWVPGTTRVQVQAFADGLAGLRKSIPEIRRLRFGADAGLGGANDDFALVADFDDVESYQRYADHPAHRHLIASLLTPIVAKRHAVQFLF
jgi:hypothetical protein